jgi:hypothetical protein
MNHLLLKANSYCCEMMRSKKQKSGRGKIRRRRLQKQKKRLSLRKWLFSIAYAWKIIVGLSVVLTIIGTIYSLSPKVSVASYSNLNPADPFTTPFIITNNSSLPLHNVSARCKVDKLEGVKLYEEEIECETCPIKSISLTGYESGKTESIPQIESGESSTFICSSDIPISEDGELVNTTSTTGAEITIFVRYRPSWVFWHHEQRFRFVTAKNANGQLVWIPLPASYDTSHSSNRQPNNSFNPTPR